MMIRKRNRVGGLLLLLAVTSLLVSCGEPVGGRGKSPVFLVADPANDYIEIDVYNASEGVLAIGDDYESITLRSMYKGEGTNTLIQTQFAEVVIQEYRVTYYRVDGDPEVPDPFVVQTTVRIPAGGSTTIDTLIMPRDAKLKSPLRELAFGGGEGYIRLNALVEFFGEDLIGNHVSTKVVLYLNVSDL